MSPSINGTSLASQPVFHGRKLDARKLIFAHEKPAGSRDYNGTSPSRLLTRQPQSTSFNHPTPRIRSKTLTPTHGGLAQRCPLNPPWPNSPPRQRVSVLPVVATSSGCLSTVHPTPVQSAAALCLGITRCAVGATETTSLDITHCDINFAAAS